MPDLQNAIIHALTLQQLLRVSYWEYLGYPLPLFSSNRLTVSEHEFKGFFKMEKELTFH